MTKAFFITGTDTEIGKTTIACGLLAKAQQQRLTTAAIKPIASGCEQTTNGLRNQDALALWQQVTIDLTYSEINPIALQPAIAPHIAAKEAGLRLTIKALLPSVTEVLSKQADFMVIEGAGGWRVPLNDKEYLSDLAKALQLPVILVVGIRLGCVNHAILTLEAIKQDGLKPVAWVANSVEANTARLTENLQTLQTHLNIPCLGLVPYLTEPTATHIADYLDMSPLLESL